MLKRLYSFYLKKRKPLVYARKIGVEIGDNLRLVGSPNWGSEPWLIRIGEHTLVSFDVSFVTHDAGTWCFRNQESYKHTVKFGRIKVGDNCFIGAKSTILPGVTIGNNCIVAAGAVVSKDIPSGEVWGGVPAKFIMTMMEYAEKCLANTPSYDYENYKTNFKEEVMHICDMMEERHNEYFGKSDRKI